MSDVSVNSVKPSEVSDRMVALYLLGMVAEAQGARVNSRAGVPMIEGGMTKKQILKNYLDCLVAVKSSNGTRQYIDSLPD